MSSKKYSVENKYIEVDFKGVIQSCVRAKLVIELIKYMMYQHHQIPLTFEQLKSEIDLEEKEPRTGKSGGVSRKLEMKKRDGVVDSLETLFSKLEEVFNMGAPIRQVVLLLGATVVTPKEVVSLQLPSLLHDGPVLTWRSCQQQLFQKLVTDDHSVDITHSKPTKLTVLVEASRNFDFSRQKILPRLDFKMPTRGRHLTVNLQCQTHLISSELSQLDETDLEISGIEPLERSTLDSEVFLRTAFQSTPAPSADRKWKQLEHSNSRVPIVTIDQCMMDTMDTDDMEMIEGPNRRLLSTKRRHWSSGNKTTEDSGICTDCTDFIWYQIPGNVQGYKVKCESSKSSSGIFG